MLTKILRCLRCRRAESKRKCKQSKRDSKRTHTDSTPKQQHKKFNHTTKGERDHMFTLYRQGFSIHNIAGEMGRSSRTVHQRLTHNGTRPLPDQDLVRSDRAPTPTEKGRRHRLRHRQTDAQKPDGQFDFVKAFMDQAGPQLFQSSLGLLEKDPELARQVVGAVMGVKISKKSLDDIIHEEIYSNPEIRRQWAEAHLEHMKRNGRTEMDIVGEGVEVLLKLAKELNRDSWPRVVRDLEASGELSRIAMLWKAGASPEIHPGSGGVRQGPQEINASSSVPSDRTPEIPLQIPLALQRKGPQYPANLDPCL